MTYRTPEKNIRLIAQTEPFATEIVRDFATVEEAVAAVDADWFDWVVKELTNPRVPGTVGRVIYSREEAEQTIGIDP